MRYFQFSLSILHSLAHMSKHKKGSPSSVCITEQCLAETNNQHGLGEGEEEGEIGVRRRHQQETEHATPSSAATTSTRVLPREARGTHLQDKHGKEAQRETSRKQE